MLVGAVRVSVSEKRCKRPIYDGRVEAVVESLVGEPLILSPENGLNHHWVSFQLEGVNSNRLVLNARAAFQ